MKLTYEKLKGLAISEHGMLFHTETGSIFTTNQIGTTILKALKEGKDIDAVKERLISEYDIYNERYMEKDVMDFIAQLIGLGLIDKETDD